MARSPVSRGVWQLAQRSSTVLPYVPQFFQCGRMRGCGHPQLVQWLQSRPGRQPVPPDAALTVYRQHPNLVCEMPLPAAWGLPWSHLVVKRFGWRGIQHYLASPCKRSRALKAYRAACHLLAHGLRTPLPLGMCEERRRGFVQYNVYITEALADVVTLQQYAAHPPDGPAGLQEVLRLVATYTRQMHDSGLWHRDLVASNVLLSGPPGHRHVYLVDLNRARHLPYMPLMVRAMDLARLGWRDWWPQFCALYSDGRFSATRLLWMIRLYRRWRTLRWHGRRVLKPVRAWLRL